MPNHAIGFAVGIVRPAIFDSELYAVVARDQTRLVAAIARLRANTRGIARSGSQPVGLVLDELLPPVVVGVPLVHGIGGGRLALRQLQYDLAGIAGTNANDLEVEVAADI